MFIEIRSGLYINVNRIRSIYLDGRHIRFRIEDGRDQLISSTDEATAQKTFEHYLDLLNQDPTIEILRTQINDLEKNIQLQQAQIDELHQMILYQPGGQIYQRSKTNFESRLEN